MVVAEPPQVVKCEGCGTRYVLSVRRVRQHRQEGKPHRCKNCRFPAAGPTPEQIEQAKRWWLARYSLTELQSWPPLEP